VLWCGLARSTSSFLCILPHEGCNTNADSCHYLAVNIMLAVYRGYGYFVSCNPEASNICKNFTKLM
jgi:hypothetical protein